MQIRLPIVEDARGGIQIARLGMTPRGHIDDGGHGRRP
jgi:hypothetical protein